MGKVISFLEKTEIWSLGYVSPNTDFSVMVSNHGRFKINCLNSKPVFLEFVDSVNVLSQLSLKIEESLDLLHKK